MPGKRQDKDLLANVEAFKYGFRRAGRQEFQGRGPAIRDVPWWRAGAGRNTDPVYGA